MSTAGTVQCKGLAGLFSRTLERRCIVKIEAITDLCCYVCLHVVWFIEERRDRRRRRLPGGGASLLAHLISLFSYWASSLSIVLVANGLSQKISPLRLLCCEARFARRSSA